MSYVSLKLTGRIGRIGTNPMCMDVKYICNSNTCMDTFKTKQLHSTKLQF